MGVWPELYPGTQFPRGDKSLNQFFHQMAPNTGPFDLDVNAAAVSALFDRIGAGVLVTHSQSGGLGWRTAMKNPNIKAIVSFETGSNFAFPEGELPEPIEYVGGSAIGIGVSLSDFMALTRIPIVIYYGDHIPAEPSTNPGQDQWRNCAEWRDAVNAWGGDVTVVHLPEAGVRGNTHFMMQDLNNVEIADHMT